MRWEFGLDIELGSDRQVETREPGRQAGFAIISTWFQGAVTPVQGELSLVPLQFGGKSVVLIICEWKI